MALNWQWSNKCGTVTMSAKSGSYTYNWYEGNAMMIIIDEYHDNDTDKDMYNMIGFFCDEEHAKRCLGLMKGTTNIYEEYPFTRVTINKAKCTKWRELMDILASAFDNIEIVLTKEE